MCVVMCIFNLFTRTITHTYLLFIPNHERTQTHALNILRNLFQDSNVMIDVQGMAEDAFMVAVKGFASPAWAVRNGSLLLFGALVTRLLGAKRVRDEHSRLNAVTASEFFERCVLNL